MQCQLTKMCAMIMPLTEKLKSVALLGLRLLLAYTFFAPAMMKLGDIESTALWFGSMGIPLPTLNAYMAAGTEMAGVVLLTLGLFSRLISIPLLVTMLVAFITVHGGNGFNVISETVQFSNPYVNGELVEGTVVLLQNGYENILYYSLMLFVILTHGAGTLSIDHVIAKKMSEKRED